MARDFERFREFRNGLHMLNIHMSDSQMVKLWRLMDIDGSGEELQDEVMALVRRLLPTVCSAAALCASRVRITFCGRLADSLATTKKYSVCFVVRLTVMRRRGVA